MPQNRQFASLAELLSSAVDGLVATVEGMHQAIATRSFETVAAASPVPEVARSAQLVHDEISSLVYEIIRSVNAVAAPAVRLGAGFLPEPPPSKLGTMAQAALNGFVGDFLEDQNSELRFDMGLRHNGEPLVVDRTTLAATFPTAGPRLAVFVHGLCETEDMWQFRSRDHHGQPGVSHGSRLQQDLGMSPLWVRYNSGLHISDNGKRLSALLDRLLGAWPVPPTEIVLIGHSMGGLVIRAACDHGARTGCTWTPLVQHAIYLGSPHDGAPLEKVANVVGYLLDSFDETAPLGKIWNGRSAGIKDLRFGNLRAEDWEGRDPDALLEDSRDGAPLLPTATHHFLAATLTEDPQHPVAHFIGDLLVRYPSATGITDRRTRVGLTNIHHMGGMHHLTLLNHPDVYEVIRAAIAR